MSVDLKILIAKLIKKTDPLIIAEQLLNAEKSKQNGTFKVDRKDLSSEERKAVTAFVRMMRKEDDK
jgi:hypothetical protein